MTAACRRLIDILGRPGYIRGMRPLIPCDVSAGRRMNRHQRGRSRKGPIAQVKTTRKDAPSILSGHDRRLAREAGE
jgi:hypothetical protein